MKKIIIKTFFATVILISAGCKKVINYDATRTFVAADDAMFKINYTSAYALNPSVQLVINGQRVSNLIAGRTPFPGGGYNTNGSNYPDYLKVPASATSLKISIPQKNTNTDSVILYSVTTASLKAGSYYTLHVGDTLTKTNSLLIEDDVTMPVAGLSVFRFVNLMPNVAAVDLYFNTTLVAGGIPYLGSGAYFSLPVPATAGTWFIRETGTPATGTALTSYSNVNTNISQRVYTVFASGYKNSSATNTKPYVSFLLTR